MKKKAWKKILASALAAALVVTSFHAIGVSRAAAEPQTSGKVKLWYDKPASQGTNILGEGGFGTTPEDNTWQQQTLPIGNSFMGANIYGEISNEHLTFNHKTLWNGGPSTSRPKYNGGNLNKADVYKQVIELYKKKQTDQANKLAEQLVGDSNGYGAYQSWGDIFVDFDLKADQAQNYQRSLDLENAIAAVDFDYNNTKMHREYFASYADDVIAMKFTADGDEKLNFTVSFPVDNAEGVQSKNLGKDVTTTASGDTIVVAGQMQDNQMKMNGQLKVVLPGAGSVQPVGEKLQVNGAKEAVIYVAADTDYLNEYPTYRTGETDAELAASVTARIDNAVSTGYKQIKARHLEDYKELFDRVHLDLGQGVSTKPTDQLLAGYMSKGNTNSTEENRQLEVMLFQFGRYLTISASRENDLPANLQGVWQNRVGDHNRVPWGSDYHMNVNLQMNYWPTYSTNLAECAKPLVDYVNSLVEPGKVTAKSYFGVTEGGFTAHTQNTPFGWTCPGWAFSWGWSPAALPWILQNCWEYYEYTGDVDYMREHLYPMMKEAALLYDQILIPDPNGTDRLVSAPAYSPEHGPVTAGNTYEQSLIWQLYEDTITAAKVLGVDQDKVTEWTATQARLKPIEVGESGQIKEWYNETTLGSMGSRNHRHMSHLLGLFPGDLISVDNPEFMNAAKVSLLDRGDSATGWGIGQRLNAWARTGDGEHAHTIVKTLFKDGIYPNLFDSHAPFQIDGNFGYTSGVAEMLMQSNMGYINTLPALPSVWATGKVEGLLARGNFELSMEWAGQKLTKATVQSNNGGEAKIQIAGATSITVTDAKGNTVTATTTDNKTDRFAFPTEVNGVYTITPNYAA